jgi:phenylacetate-CoA ligase
MPVIKEIFGRVEDTVVGRDGREIVRFHGIFIDLPNLIEAQVVQEDYDVFTIKAVASGTLTEKDKVIIRQRMESQLGQIQLSIVQVSTIPRNVNGKFQAVVSKVKRPSPSIG